jgi:hypothetical protein
MPETGIRRYGLQSPNIDVEAEEPHYSEKNAEEQDLHG